MIKRISKDEVEFEDGMKINLKDLDYKLIKPLIWWGDNMKVKEKQSIVMEEVLKIVENIQNGLKYSEIVNKIYEKYEMFK
ncbi:MAG: hypothetical protein NZ889_00695 [Candidatus Pacearchaeota archaeon]|nr:hypothetical protein [Candidatus Pacearchaeota archaeon]